MASSPGLTFTVTSKVRLHLTWPTMMHVLSTQDPRFDGVLVAPVDITIRDFVEFRYRYISLAIIYHHYIFQSFITSGPAQREFHAKRDTWPRAYVQCRIYSVYIIW